MYGLIIITHIMDTVEFTVRTTTRKQVAYHNFMEILELRHIDQIMDCEFHIREQFEQDVENGN